MKIIALLLFIYSSAFAMPILTFSNDNSFNAILTIYIYATAIIAPTFGAMSFLRN